MKVYFVFWLLTIALFFGCKKKQESVTPVASSLSWENVFTFNDTTNGRGGLQCTVSADSQEIYFLTSQNFYRYNASNTLLEKRPINYTSYYEPPPPFLSQNFYVIPTFTSGNLDTAKLDIFPTASYSKASDSILQTSFLGEYYHYVPGYVQTMSLNSINQLVVAYCTPVGNWNLALFNILQGDTVKLTFNNSISVPLNNNGLTSLWGLRL